MTRGVAVVDPLRGNTLGLESLSGSEYNCAKLRFCYVEGKRCVVVRGYKFKG